MIPGKQARLPVAYRCLDNYFWTGKFIAEDASIDKNIAIIFLLMHVFLKMKMIFNYDCGLLVLFKS